MHISLFMHYHFLIFFISYTESHAIVITCSALNLPSIMSSIGLAAPDSPYTYPAQWYKLHMQHFSLNICQCRCLHGLHQLQEQAVIPSEESECTHNVIKVLKIVAGEKMASIKKWCKEYSLPMPLFAVCVCAPGAAWRQEETHTSALGQ